MKIEKISPAEFELFYNSINVPAKYDKEFIYSLFENLVDSYNSTILKDVNIKEFTNINPFKLCLYLISEYDFFAHNLDQEKLEELHKNDNLLSAIISFALDKYLTNEKIDLNEKFYTSKYSINISTLNLYLNFMLKMTDIRSQNNPGKTLIADIMKKCIQISKCSLDLLVDGFEAESLSTWRTLHETECILRLLVTYKEPLINAYLRHMKYAIAYRAGLSTKEATDEIFVEIKDNLKKLNLKSKDMKKYIEYGYLLAIPNIELDKDFKLNFRDGVEKLAGLSDYSKLYEYSSEIAHSSPLMIYSNEKTLFHMSLIALYEVFFRIERIFTESFLAVTENEAIKNSYKTMRSLYYGQLIEIYNREKAIAGLKSKKS